ncbi:PREDICTED: uncharacterized protein LOC103323594 [Prunus mume]|uniref:Uncharacterized protein LOC103323594 n=1 Tax=Prunus mume TaxID=102107 RepID=A0ABM0NF13_PRUMU|nr:PREDICTED: uncharacterized protein LOC103323594 [Prunus mume]
MEDHFVSEGMQMKTMKKKRKEVEELDQVNDDFSDFSLSSPARKIRRLDAHLPPIMEEEEAEFSFSAAQNQLKSEAPIIEGLPSENQEKAIVLFRPVNNTPVFSLHSDLISGFKDQFLRTSHFGLRSSAEEDDEAVQSNSNQCKAVVPWVPSHLSPAPSMEVSQADPPEELMEAEGMETATMEIEEESPAAGQAMADGYGGGMWTSNEGFPQWQQQHCMIPQPPHNTTTPITWLQ